MTPENFCYWLQGVFEVGNPTELSKEQLDVVKEHLQLVFNKVTVLQAKPVVGTATDILKDVKPASKTWEDYLKEIYKIPQCAVAWPPNGEITDIKTGKSVTFPFMFQYPDGTPVASC